jgi:uncharacterized protein with NAD-binding domain and iron-sulfur cluster
MKKCCIVGGGIAGMVTAFYLAQQDPSWEIHLYEKGSILGGYARTTLKNQSEHSPRVILPGYDNFLKLCKEIGVTQWKPSTKRTVGFPSSMYLLPVLIKLLPYLFQNPYANDSKSLTDVLKGIDAKAYNLIKSKCYMIGEPIEQMPVAKLMKLLRSFACDPLNGSKTFTTSTGEAFLEPLERKLIDLGVHIHKNSTLHNMKVNTDGSIQSFTINNQIVNATTYVLALDIRALYKLFPLDYGKLYNKTYDEQMGLQLHFDSDLIIDTDYMMLNSDWYLIIRQQKNTMSICIPSMKNEKSKRLNKTAKFCNKTDLVTEVYNQIVDHVPYMKKYKIIRADIWESWSWNGYNWTTKEPYFLNSINTANMRPTTITKYTNLFMAGAIVQTPYYSWFMESAVESGIMASNLILGKKSHNKTKTILFLIFFSSVCLLLLAYYLGLIKRM